MKKLILIGFLFSLIFLSVLAKDKKEEVILPKDANGKIVYTEVVEMPNVTKDILYSRAYEWFAKTFNSAQNVIQMQDKENGKIVGKGSFDEINVSQAFGMNRVKGFVKFTISIYLKDGKYKYEMTDFIHEAHFDSSWTSSPNGGALENEKPDCGRNSISLGNWKKIKELVNERVLLLIESLKKAMTVETAGDNW